MTDRMDCQILNGFFVYLYYQSFIAVGRRETVGGLMQMAIMGLSTEGIVELVKGLETYLANQGIAIHR